MSQLEVDKIIPQSGTTLTIGDSGDTVNFADGTSIGIDTNTLYIDSTNNKVGIGTTTPDTLLHLESDTPHIRITDTNNSRVTLSTRLEFYGTDGSAGNIGMSAGILQIVHDHAKPVIFKNSNTERMRIDTSTGNVGIGTSSPSATLNIQSSTDASIDIDATSGSTQDAFIKFTSPDNGVVYLGVDDSEQLFKINNATNLSSDNHFVINGSGNVGIGTSSPESALDVSTGTITQREGNVRNTISSSGTGFEFIANATSQNVTRNFVFKSSTSGGAVTERMRIDSSGNVGIGTTNPIGLVNIVQASNTQALLRLRNNTADTSAADGMIFTITDSSSPVGSIEMISGGSDAKLAFRTNGAERMRIHSNGQVLVAGTSLGDSVSEIIVDNGATTGTYGFRHQGGGRYMRMGCPNSSYAYWETNTTAGFLISGNTFVSGALSKSSGSFKIDHPLPEKTNTHHLVHSFVESPQADNIYRGKINLVNGTATVNIDTVAGMSEGTFVLLNRGIQCFTSNETGWTAVKGSVSGNTLTITAQDNTCTDTISWMVIGERQDQHMYDTNWTDDNGKVIVEPLKETETQP